MLAELEYHFLTESSSENGMPFVSGNRHDMKRQDRLDWFSQRLNIFISYIFRPPGRQSLELRYIGALGDADPYIGSPSVDQIVPFETAAQPACLDADDGIDLRIE